MEPPLFAYDPTERPALDREYLSLRGERALLVVVIVSLTAWLVVAWRDFGAGWAR